MTPLEERRAAKARYMRQLRASWTDERRAVEREASRLRMNAHYARLTPERKRLKVTAGNEQKQQRRIRKRAEMDARRLAQRNATRVENLKVMATDTGRIYRTIVASIPRTLHRDIRDDIAQDLVVAVLEGDVAVGDIGSHVKHYVALHFRQREWRRHHSLDALVPGTDRLAFIDTVASPDWSASASGWGD